MTVLIANIILTVSTVAGTYLARAMRHDWPLTGWLDRAPDPARLLHHRRKPCTTAANTASTTKTSGTKSPAGARKDPTPTTSSDTPPWTVPPSRGRHAATAPRTSLSLVFDTQQGRYRHAETGPMPGLGDVDAMLTAERGWWAR